MAILVSKGARRSLALVLAVLVVLGGAGPARAIPPVPASFWGKVKINGQNVPVGTAVTAWSGGVQYAVFYAQMYEGETWYALDVPGDDDDTPGVKEGPLPGELVSFKIGDLSAAETGTWQSNTLTRLDLSATGVIYTPTPEPSATPTSSPTPYGAPVQITLEAGCN